MIAQQLDLMTQQQQQMSLHFNQQTREASGQLEEFAWSEWSPWSSCVDKNGLCDATRLHSRLRKCMSQLTGVPSDSSKCKQRFDFQDKDFEVSDCSRTCANSPSGSQQLQLASPQHAARQAASMGDILLDDAPSKPTVVLPTQQADINEPKLLANPPLVTPSLMNPNLFAQNQHQPQLQQLSAPPGDLLLPQQQVSCSNCTNDEICLFLQTSRVPFCAKIREPSDASGCAGWCKAPNQVCQPMASSAFKCVQDASECLQDEWRCHDTQCIPLSKRCDGHANCYDSSDERDCPSASQQTGANRSTVSVLANATDD